MIQEERSISIKEEQQLQRGGGQGTCSSCAPAFILFLLFHTAMTELRQQQNSWKLCRHFSHIYVSHCLIPLLKGVKI